MMGTGTNDRARSRQLSPHLLIGVALIAVAWPMAWFGPDPYSGYTFTPLWLGYILAVDGLTALRSGTSPLTRSPRAFALPFVFSIPLWWLFELANLALQNWEYQLPHKLNLITKILLGSLRFSTVMPALLVTAEFWRTFPFFAGKRRWIRVSLSRSGLKALALTGLGMIAVALLAPNVAFPLIWIGLFLLLDPINTLTGAKSIFEQIAERRWDTVFVLCTAGVTCGFFWEMWNVKSASKWIYHIPHVGFLKVFEMPILGYGGYLPFALEVYTAYHLMHMLVFRTRDRYLTFDA